MRLLKHRWSRLTRNAWRNRQELIAGGMCTRRDLLKLGLLTGAGYLVAKHGLSTRAHAADMISPPTPAFVQPLPIMPVKRPYDPLVDGDFGPDPTKDPNNLGGEGRTRRHQAFFDHPSKFPNFPPAKVFQVRQRLAEASVSPNLPQQQLWGFDGKVPGPTYHALYGEDILVRNRNDLPSDNGGFGIQQVSTHLHNLHTPSESDGFPGDYFPNPENPAIANATFYDHHYPNVLAGFSSGFPPNGDLRESLSTLWYHDHRVAFTAQNVYKGLAGFYLLFNHLDTGDETRGFHLPGRRDPNDFYAPVQYDIPLMLADRLFDAESGLLFFDLFETDGILGDKFLVNGAIQPYLDVEPRRYRFRVLDGGPSRFYQLFLTDQGANTSIPFWQIANDGNLLPKPLPVTSVTLGVAERIDIIIDFSRFKPGTKLYLENRMNQIDGKGPVANLGSPFATLPAGKGGFILQFRVGDTVTIADESTNLDDLAAKKLPLPSYYELPPRPIPRITRTLNFERELQTWMVNGKAFPDAADVVHFRVKRNSAEQWNLMNSSGGWMHPIHIHFEEFRLFSRNGVTIGAGNPEFSRKDVLRVQHGELNSVSFRFRDFSGRYPVHCHNTIHEDHAMMLRWDIDEAGDNKREP